MYSLDLLWPFHDSLETFCLWVEQTAWCCCDLIFFGHSMIPLRLFVCGWNRRPIFCSHFPCFPLDFRVDQMALSCCDLIFCSHFHVSLYTSGWSRWLEFKYLVLVNPSVSNPRPAKSAEGREDPLMTTHSPPFHFRNGSCALYTGRQGHHGTHKRALLTRNSGYQSNLPFKFHSFRFGVR